MNDSDHRNTGGERLYPNPVGPRLTGMGSRNPCVASRIVEVGGITTHYLTAGDGPPLVLLHSGEFGASARLCWERQIPGLARHFRVVAPDWLGFGGTDKLRDFVSGSDRMIRHLAAFLRVLMIDDADFAGCSMGGTMLLREVASGHSRLAVRRMILISAGGFVPDNEHRRALLDYDGTEAGMRRIVEATHSDPAFAQDEEYVRRRVAASLEPGAWEAVASARFKAPNVAPRPDFGHADTVAYESVTIPTLAVVGSADKLRQPGYHSVFARMPRGETVVLEGAGHLLNIERADECTKAMLEFLRRAPEDRTR